MKEPRYIVVLVTCKNKTQARAMAAGLLQARLIACANIINGVESHFWWQGAMDRAGETLLVMKTKRMLFTKVVAKVKSLHTYDVPEVIALPIVGGNWDYLRWIEESVG